MSWIEIIPYSSAKGKLKKLYNRVKGPENNVDNIMLAHGLRPHSMEGHMVLYKNVIHNRNNTVPKWFLETIGAYVSFLNKCDYCIHHHSEGLKKILNNIEKHKTILSSLQTEEFYNFFDSKYTEALNYAKLLTVKPTKVSENNIQKLKETGFSDGEILEINQVVSYFNYANRTVLGLGITTEGDILGLSPNDDADENNWNHQ